MKKCLAFLLAAGLGIASGLVVAVVFQITDVEDNTMLPSYEAGHKVLVSRIQESPERGDVVLFPNRVYTSTGEGGVMMKRVVAVGGDQVLITGGKVYVNNRELKENYVFTEGISGEMEQVRVPDGKVFVLGDNRASSTDSRSETVGFVEKDDIQGKVIFTW